MLLIFGVLLLIAAVISFAEPEDTFAGVADILGFIFLMIGVFAFQIRRIAKDIEAAL